MDGIRTQERATFRVNNIRYYVDEAIEYTLPTEYSAPYRDTILAVVFHAVRKRDVTSDFLQAELDRYGKEDDVYQPRFSREGILIVVTEERDEGSIMPLDESIAPYLSSLSSKILFLDDISSASLRDGPYFVRGRSIRQAWRLYNDKNTAFIESVLSTRGNPYIFERLGFSDFVAVSSRLRYPPDPNKPLNGLRMTVKDNFHLAVVYSTLGSRSCTELHRATTDGDDDTSAQTISLNNATAGAVRRLIDLGAVVVGKTRMAPYTPSVVPRGRNKFRPYNPRADGGQEASWGSNGGATSVASYAWALRWELTRLEVSECLPLHTGYGDCGRRGIHGHSRAFCLQFHRSTLSGYSQDRLPSYVRLLRHKRVSSET
ncbi:hypothetical protein F5Y17DRAFT_120049 [Xylariaceae sp. FL0594]|nr:hypothetical protein F5Y17DRAFT_120049 [Xylariaceae sp. FL0594]